MNYIILCLAGLLAVGFDGLLLDDPIQEGKIYGENSRLVSPLTGLSFVVPAGYRAYYDRDAQGVVMESESAERVIGVYGFSEVKLEEMGDVVISLIQGQGIQLNPIRVDAVDEQTLKAQFLAVTEQGAGSLFAIIRAGEYGNAVSVAALGAQGTEAGLEQAANEVMDSITWSQPAVPDWRSMLGGKQLTTSGADSHYSPGGAGGGGSYASGSNSQIDFCGDGSYAFASKSESYFSIDGVSAENSSSDAHQGMWSLVADLAGEVTLVLESTDQRVFYWPVVETENGAIVDGTAYAVQASSVCY